MNITKSGEVRVYGRANEARTAAGFIKAGKLNYRA
jgi:hypothetical protein